MTRFHIRSVFLEKVVDEMIVIIKENSYKVGAGEAKYFVLFHQYNIFDV